MKYLTNHRINVRTIRKIKEGDGLTLKNGRAVEYKTGYQVALHGVECKTPEEVSKLIHSPLYRDKCGIWLENGIYYVDYSIRISDKTSALLTGKAHNQIAIYSWPKAVSIYCE